MFETHPSDIPLIIERERANYKSLLGSKGATYVAEAKNLSFTFGDHYLSVVFDYIPMDSPAGFPFNRMTCTMRLDGKRITKAQLNELCT